MTEDFAILDFALLRAPADQVAKALEQIPAVATEASSAAGKPGLIKRLFGKQPKEKAPSAPVPKRLKVQPADSLGPAPLARMVLTDMGYGAEDDPVRLRGPVGAADLTLIELRDRTAPGDSVQLRHLSQVFAGTEVFGFRISGKRHPGSDCAFVTYMDGKPTRVLASSLPGSAQESADWTHTDKGLPQPIEAEALPGRKDPRLTHDGVSALVTALGVEPHTLFAPASPYPMVIVLSGAEGGMPVAEALAAPPAPEATQASGEWEQEVTQILVHAVEDALPPEEQIVWLDGLTARLNGGDIPGALEAARDLIARGAGPESERRASAERLAALFDHRGA